MQAIGLLRGTHIPAVKDKPMMGFWKHLCRKILGQHALHAQGSGTRGRDKTDTMTYPKHMGIHSHGWLMEDNAQHHIGGFTPYSRKANQLLHCIRHLTSIVVHQHLCHADQMTCLVVRVRYTFNIFKDYVWCGQAH